MTVRLPSVILIATAVALAGIVILWVQWMIRDGVRRGLSRRTAIYRCESCGHVYEDVRNLPLSTCTRCGTLNEAVRR